MRWLRIFALAGISFGLLSAQTDLGGSHIGLLLRDITVERAQELKLDHPTGAEVVGVENGGPAAEAGVQVHDVLLTYNGENISGKQQLGRLVSETPPGRRIGLQLWRDGHALTAWVITRAIPQVNNPFFPGLATDVPANLLVWRNRILGTVCETLPTELSSFFGVAHGVLVRIVEKGALGDTSGLRAGDVIEAASDRPILSPRDLTGALISDNGSLHRARFLIWRDHKRMTIDVRPPE